MKSEFLKQIGTLNEYATILGIPNEPVSARLAESDQIPMLMQDAVTRSNIFPQVIDVLSPSQFKNILIPKNNQNNSLDIVSLWMSYSFERESLLHTIIQAWNQNRMLYYNHNSALSFVGMDCKDLDLAFQNLVQKMEVLLQQSLYRSITSTYPEFHDDFKSRLSNAYKVMLKQWQDMFPEALVPKDLSSFTQFQTSSLESIDPLKLNKVEKFRICRDLEISLEYLNDRTLTRRVQL